MNDDARPNEQDMPDDGDAAREPGGNDSVCPVCGGPLTAEKCKVVCRSETCVYRIVLNCAEF